MYLYTAPNGETVEITGPHPNMVDLGEFLRDVPPGNWVAASRDGERVVAYAAELEEAIKLAEERGEPSPLVLKKPSESVPLAV